MKYELRTHGLTGLRYVVDLTVEQAETGLTRNVVAREGSDGVWRPTHGNGARAMRAALEAVGV